MIGLTKQLIAIDSQNPGNNEKAIAGFVATYLKRFGLPARLCQFERDRSNVIAVLPGKDRGHSLLITPHLDTVPAGKSWTRDPFCAVEDAGRLYGLGATDCKGNCAAGMEAIACLAENNIQPRCNIIFAATADEETGSRLGLIPLLEKKLLRPDYAVVTDAENCDIVVAQKGLMHLRVSVRGKRAHGAYPWRGSNAIGKAVTVLAALSGHSWPGGNHPLLRPATMNIGTIAGGDKVNIVADHCEFELDFRFLPGTPSSGLLEEIRGVVRSVEKSAAIEIEGIQEPYSIDQKHPLVRSLKRAMSRAGARPAITGSEGATVITFFQKLGIPAVATGFGAKGCAHIADEYLETETLVRGSEALCGFLQTFDPSARG